MVSSLPEHGDTHRESETVDFDSELPRLVAREDCYHSSSPYSQQSFNETHPTNQPALWSTVLSEKLTVPHLVKKYPVVYGTQRFKTAFFLTFMCPCIVRIFQYTYISNKMQRYTVYYIWKLLYMFWVVPPPIIRSAYNCIYSMWYLSHRYCYLPL